MLRLSGTVSVVRVRRIALRNPIAKLRALNHFPELESLEICLAYLLGPVLILPATFLSGSARCLRQLTLREVVLSYHYPLQQALSNLL